MIEDFFDSVPEILRSLKEDSKPEWGSMDPSTMLDHITTGLYLGMSKEAFEITTPEERLPAFQAFLMSDKPFKKMAPMPKPYVSHKIETNGDLEEKKDHLMSALDKFRKVVKDPDHYCYHPYFGKLDNEGTRMLHYKHIKHHFTQFGLITEDKMSSNG